MQNNSVVMYMFIVHSRNTTMHLNTPFCKISAVLDDTGSIVCKTSLGGCDCSFVFKKMFLVKILHAYSVL